VTSLSSVLVADTAGTVSAPLQLSGLENLVETATGPLGLLIVAGYSFLIAIALPLPSEIVLVAPLNLGLPETVDLALIVLVSGIGKAAGSVVAFHLGHEARHQSGRITEWLRDSRIDIVEWSERRTVQLARQYGYIGLALALMVPFFPDTLSIYAFTVLEENYTKFAAATFAGSVGRLLLVAGVFAPLTAIV
jgi:membrane protein YqaA with SNARE-associated domain